MNSLKQATMIVGSACLALAVIAHQIPSSQADDFTCNNLATQLAANTSRMLVEKATLDANTAMMNASVTAGDFNGAKLYSSMNKDTAIRIIGLIAEARAAAVMADNEPDNCGATEDQMKEYFQTTHRVEDEINEALDVYKKTQGQ